MTAGWTRADYEAYLQRQKGKQKDGEQRAPCPEVKPCALVLDSDGYADMNKKFRSKTEAEYAMILTALQRSNRIRSWEYEAISVNIGEGAWYTPDFLVRLQDSEKLVCIEVKNAFVREAARVRFRSAKKQFPEIVWLWAQKKKGQWKGDGVLAF